MIYIWVPDTPFDYQNILKDFFHLTWKYVVTVDAGLASAEVCSQSSSSSPSRTVSGKTLLWKEREWGKTHG